MNPIHWLKAKLPAWLWAGITTAVFTFLGLFAASLLGFVQQVVEWANNGGVTVFPDVSPLGKAAISAAGAAAAGLLNAVYRGLQKFPWFPGTGPVYPTQP